MRVRPSPRSFLLVSMAALAVAIGLVLPSCNRAAPRQPGPARVVVTIAPLEGLVKPLLPEDAQLKVLIPPGRSEHGYELTPADVASLNSADLVVLVGMGLDSQAETHLKKHVSTNRRQVVFGHIAGHDHEDHGHDHDHDHGHDHGDEDPHLWLDPHEVRKLIPALRIAVEQSLKAQGALTDAARERLNAAEKRLLDDVKALDAEYASRLEPFKGRSIVTHHAAWGRLAERYGLKVAAVIRPFEGAEPTPDNINQAADAIREQKVSVIFIEPQFSPQAAERLAQITGVRTAPLDPVGDGDWFKLMRKNLDSLAENLGKNPPPGGQ